MLDDIALLLTLVIYGLAVINCLKILLERQSPASTIAWLFFTILAPFLAVPLFFVLGKNRITMYQKLYAKRAKAWSPIAPESESQMVSREAPLEVCRSFQETFARFGENFQQTSGEIKILVNGSETFDEIFAAINSAEKVIFVQYYILRSDRLGLELKKLLMEKAEKGVKIFLLYDDMGSFWISRKYIEDLEKAGVTVRRFLPVANFKRFFQINFRNHRKLVIVDGRVAFTGGLNVGEEYVSKRFGAEKAARKHWRDTHIKLTGPVVTPLQNIFREDWHFATGDILPENLAPPVISQQGGNQQIMQLFPTGPTDDAVLSVLFLLHLIQQAKSRIIIATPYLIPDINIFKALELASYRNVNIKIIIPENSDKKMVQWVSRSYGDQLSRFGIEVHTYQPGMMHQKIFLVDDSLTAIGTMNLDNRALYFNFEVTALVFGRNFNQTVWAMLEKDLKHCRLHEPRTADWLSNLILLRDNTARILSPLL